MTDRGHSTAHRGHCCRWRTPPGTPTSPTVVQCTFLLGVRLGRDVGPEHGALRALKLDGAHLVGVGVRVRIRVRVGVGISVGVRVRVMVRVGVRVRVRVRKRVRVRVRVSVKVSSRGRPPPRRPWLLRP